MKFVFALLTVLVAASANAEDACRSTLEGEIQDFMALIDVNKIVEITLRYVAEDKQFQDMLTFFQSEEFKKLVTDVEGMPETKELMDYMENAGFHIYDWVNKINNALGIPPLKPSNLSTYKTNGIRGYLDEIEATLPIDKLKALYEKKLKECEVWKNFINQLKSDKFQQIVNKVYAKPAFQKLLTRAKEVGVDLQLIVKLLKEMLGITVPDRF